MLGIDVDSPESDNGLYGLVRVKQETSIRNERRDPLEIAAQQKDETLLQRPNAKLSRYQAQATR